MIGFVQFDPHDDNDFSGRVDISGNEAFKFTVKAVGFDGQPNVTVTLFDQWKHVFDRIRLGSFVAVDGQYNMARGKQNQVYHNLTGYKFFLDGELIEPVETDRKEVVNSPEEDESDLPF